jgi:hypothetical protein
MGCVFVLSLQKLRNLVGFCEFELRQHGIINFVVNVTINGLVIDVPLNSSSKKQTNGAFLAFFFFLFYFVSSFEPNKYKC